MNEQPPSQDLGSLTPVDAGSQALSEALRSSFAIVKVVMVILVVVFLASGFFGTMGYFFITWSYRLLDISALQSITFLGIVWAALSDVALWGKTSDGWTFVGAAIIVLEIASRAGAVRRSWSSSSWSASSRSSRSSPSSASA